MGDQNLRVWPVDGDEYGEVAEFGRHVKYRFEPHYPGATGPRNTDMVVFERGEGSEDDTELARYRLDTVLVALPGQPTPPSVLESEQARRVTHTSSTSSAGATKKSTSGDAGKK